MNEGLNKNDERQDYQPNTNINVNGTTYDVFEDWLKIAKKHYAIDEESLKMADEDLDASEVNLLKAGMFGYNNEIMAQEVKAATAHRNVLYDEYFINSASFPQSIYKFAKTYNVPISTSTPARMKIKLAIRKNDLINSPLRKEIIGEQYVQNNTLRSFEVILPRNYHFTVGKYKYMLPYDVLVLLRQRNNGEYSITARYDMDENLYQFTRLNTVEIRTYQDLSDGQEYVYFDLDIYQVMSQTSTHNVVTNNMAENMYFTAQYQDQIAGFNVYYNYMGEKYPLKLYFNNMYTPEDPDEKFAYYTFVDDDKLQISFSNMAGSFRPAFNSNIEIEVLSSTGSEANFTFNGKIEYSLENVDRSSFKTMLMSVAPITSSAGGRDRLTIEEEKQRIINQITTRDNLVTEQDLNNYFEAINMDSTFNNSNLTFMKKRDDVLLRVYNAFLLMRDEDQKVIPSNTSPLLRQPVQWFVDTNNGNSSDGYVIPEHSIFKYNLQSQKYEHIGQGFTEEIKDEMLNDKDNLLYINPFLIKIDTDPILNAHYYKLDINEQFDMQYSYRNSLVDSTLMVNRVDIDKTVNYEEDLSSDTYNLKLNLNTNESIQDIDERVKIRGILLSRETGEKYGYFDFERDRTVEDAVNNSDSTYIANLSTNRKFRKGKLSLTDSLYDLDGNVIDDVFIDEDTIIKVGVLYHDPTRQYQTSDNLNEEISLFNDAFPSDVQSEYNIRDYVLATSVTTMNSVNLYKDLTDIMTSTVYRAKDQTNLPNNARDFMIEMIPLVGMEYFISNNEYLYELLDNYIDILNGTIPRLENNTTVDLKFVNTRGPSRYFYLNTDVHMDSIATVPVGRTDILLDFKIHVYEPINDEFDEVIKDFIADYIETSNESGTIPISNLISLLESNFNMISFIEFNGITGSYADNVSNKYQKIMAKDTDLKYMDKQEVIEFVPEFINTKKQLYENWVTIEDPDSGITHQTSIGKRYDNVINITYQVV